MMTWGSQARPPAFLADCTMYTSAEPCAMHAGAANWAGIGRVVYGHGEAELKLLIGDHPENRTLDLPCWIVFAVSQRDVAVIGPLLVEEASALHRGQW